MTTISLRPATEQDWDFVIATTEACMREYAEQIWGNWIRDERESFTPATHQIIESDGVAIGCIELLTEPSALLLEKLYIDPAHQNGGIGSFLLQQWIAEARATDRTIRLRVLSVNPARRFYERHGFVAVRATPERVFMEWRGAS